MTGTRIGLALGGVLLAMLPGAALAFGGGGGGGGGSGSGLSPYSALNGNDRSAGVNNGNYRDPALDPYLRTYAPEAAAGYAAPPGPQPEPARRLRLRPYYGQPY
ncbi:hypothetical protein J4O73_04235 [Methylobacterium sp. NFXW15]